MDRIPVCGIGDPGPIPGESTMADPERAFFLGLCRCSF